MDMFKLSKRNKRFVSLVVLVSYLIFGVSKAYALAVRHSLTEQELQRQYYVKKYQIFLENMPKSIQELNDREPVQRARNRDFFKKDDPYVPLETFPQTVLIYPGESDIPKQFEILLTELLLKIRSIIDDNTHIYLQQRGSHHVTIHPFYWKGSDEARKEKEELPLGNENVRENCKEAIREYFKDMCIGEILFDKLVLTPDGSLMLCGMPIKDEGVRIQQLRQRLFVMQEQEGYKLMKPAPFDIIHMSLGKICPGAEGEEPRFLISKEAFEKLKALIKEYNDRKFEDKLKLKFDNLALVASKSPFHEDPQYIESIYFSA